MSVQNVQNPIAAAALEFWHKAEKSQWHQVQGISMWPVLQSGDRVLVAPEIEHLTVGDIVLVRFNQRLLVHRIEKVASPGELVTWGDFNLAPDPQAEAAQLIGRVARLERNGQELSLSGWRSLWGNITIRARPAVKPIIRLLRFAIRLRRAFSRKERNSS